MGGFSRVLGAFGLTRRQAHRNRLLQRSIWVRRSCLHSLAFFLRSSFPEELKLKSLLFGGQWRQDSAWITCKMDANSRLNNQMWPISCRPGERMPAGDNFPRQSRVRPGQTPFFRCRVTGWHCSQSQRVQVPRSLRVPQTWLVCSAVPVWNHWTPLRYCYENRGATLRDMQRKGGILNGIGETCKYLQMLVQVSNWVQYILRSSSYQQIPALGLTQTNTIGSGLEVQRLQGDVSEVLKMLF